MSPGDDEPDQPEFRPVDWAHYRSLMKRPRPAQGPAMQIGPSTWARRLWRAALWIGASALLLGVFVVLFVQFTNNFRVALVIVTLMFLYMMLMSRMAEGRFDRRN